MTPRVRPAAGAAVPRRRAGVRRQEREPGRAARGRDPGAARVRPVDRRRSRRSCATAAWQDRIAARARRRSRSATSTRIGRASHAIAEAMRAAPVPEAVRDEIAERYAALGEDSPPVAVRSSAVGEDSQDATFAGQQETYLWVRGAEQRVRRGARLLGQPVQPAGHQLSACAWRTARSAGDGRDGAADGRRRGIRRDVHLQPAERRSEHGRRQRQLGSRPGRGRRRGHARRLPGQQGHARGRARARAPTRRCSTCPAPTGSGAVRVAGARRSGRDARCLEQPALERLVDVARRVERHFGCHQDIEWAIAHDGGELFVRPDAAGHRDGQEPAQTPKAGVGDVADHEHRSAPAGEDVTACR